MSSRQLFALLALFFVAASLAGCASGASPVGLAPALDAADLQVSTDNYVEVERLLIHRAGFDEPPPNGEGKWYPVVIAGYSYVDEKCNAFMDRLFEEDRRLQAARNQLSDIASTTTAILTATSAARADIGVVAAAFGLANQTIDNYQIVRLVDLGPTKVHNLVAKAQYAYRTKTNNDWPLFGNRAFAMQAIAGYLDLCRVPTIVTNIDKAIEVAAFVPDDAGIQLSPKLRIVGGSEPSTNSIREDAGLNELPVQESTAVAFARGQFGDSRSARADLVITRPAPASKPRITGGMTDFEKDIPVSRGTIIQSALCVDQDGNFGSDASSTRIAIKTFKQHWADQEEDAAASDRSGLLTSLWASRIETSRTCKGYNSLYEKLRWNGVSGNDADDNNKHLADALVVLRQDLADAATAGTALPPGVSTNDVTDDIIKSVGEAKDLNGSVRKAFAIISNAARLGGGSTLDEKLWRTILTLKARKKT